VKAIFSVPQPPIEMPVITVYSGDKLLPKREIPTAARNVRLSIE